MVFWLRSYTFVWTSVFFLYVALKLLLLRTLCSAHRSSFVMLLNFSLCLSFSFSFSFSFLFPFFFLSSRPCPCPCRCHFRHLFCLAKSHTCPHNHWYLGCPDGSNPCNSLQLCCPWMRFDTMTLSSATMCHGSDATFTPAIRTKG